VFIDRTEAEWAFDLLAESFGNLGVTTPDDPRICLAVAQEQAHLRLSYANWMILSMEPLSDDPQLLFLVAGDTPGVAELPGGNFRTAAGDTRFALKRMSRTGFKDRPGLRAAAGASQRDVVTFFKNLKASSLRRHHSPLLADAVLDLTVRDELLTLGLDAYRAKHTGTSAEHPAFTFEARDLLQAMANEPTKHFCEGHRDELTTFVQDPLQHLLKTVAHDVEPALRDTLETEKRLFSVFTKNDYGKGGAWPWYWGAFYPKGGKRSQSCQLYVFLDAHGLSYGFSIGNYAGDERQRFVLNASRNREALAGSLGDTVNAPEFEFGEENESLEVNEIAVTTGLDLAGWLTSVDEVGTRCRVVVPWDELVLMEKDDLVQEVTSAFDRLYPLVLLGMLDDPMPTISAYSESEPIDANPAYSLDDLAVETSLPLEQLESWVRAIQRKGQAILYGPPGTGKTYVAERLAKHLVAGGTGITELVQFHPAYAYEDFMQGIRPKAREGGGLDYPVVDGRFKQFCQQARGTEGVSVLIIDEVNRANLARVFGELMYLLEYRDKSIPLASGGTFSIPANVRIIGTMNTADRSIALVDHALRRRFAFLALYPDYQMLLDYHAKDGGGFDPARLIAVLRELNAKIGDRHYEVGTSFFMRGDIQAQLPDVWRMEIEPYLEEYFFDQAGTVASYRWDEVKKRLGAD
jgi:5-methylcytosine-specific restriction protein B